MSDTYTNDSTGQKFEEVNIAGYDDDYPTIIIKPIPPEPKRWRAEENHAYWAIDSGVGVITDHEDRGKIENYRYEFGNYFKTEHQAELAADAIRELLKVIHEPDESRSKIICLDLNNSISKAREALAES